jgi:hypothetical protein
MVSPRSFFAATSLGMILAAAATGAPNKTRPSGAPNAEDRSAQQLMENCDAHKFETVITSVVDGEPHKSKVRLCGRDGQSDTQWVGTLKDAIAKLNANIDMPADVRAQIVTAINAEIARLENEHSAKAEETTLAPRLSPRAPDQLAEEYSALPPMPATPPPPPRVLGPGSALSASGSAPVARKQDRQLSRPELQISGEAAPKLTFTCYSPDDLAGDAPCMAFDRQTSLTIRAGENIPAGVSLLFLRNGEQRATIELAQLGRGKSVRLSLPREVCQGVGDGSLELQVMRNGSLLKSDGPYSLRC